MRNIGLDLLRILAVLLVIGRHLNLPENCPTFVRRLCEGGWVGVDMFFVLSGFLVSSLLFREHKRRGAVDVKRFLIRRAFKIYPAFWLFLMFTLVAEYSLHHHVTIKNVLGEVLFLQNYLGGLWNHTWSLAVEEHFYLGLALLVTALVALNPSAPFRRIPTVFACIAVTCLGFRLLNLAIYEQHSDMAFLYGTHIRIDSLMFGVLLSYLWNFKELQFRTAGIPSWGLVAVGVMMLSPAFVFQVALNKWVSVFGVILFYLGAGFLVVAALRWRTSESRLIRMFAGLGAASYSIYLWHMPVAVWGNAVCTKIIGFDSFGLYLFNAMVTACVVGWLLNRLVENPAMMARDRFFPSQTRAVTSDHQSGVAETNGTMFSDGRPIPVVD